MCLADAIKRRIKLYYKNKKYDVINLTGANIEKSMQNSFILHAGKKNYTFIQVQRDLESHIENDHTYID